jgi:hypothetical protein
MYRVFPIARVAEPGWDQREPASPGEGVAEMGERPLGGTGRQGRLRTGSPSHELRVDVPDRQRAFTLLQRLPHGELTRAEPESWAVISSADGNLTETLATIQQWLRDEAIEQTIVYLDDRAHTMKRD